jgi:hypothetical protein
MSEIYFAIVFFVLSGFFMFSALLQINSFSRNYCAIAIQKNFRRFSVCKKIDVLRNVVSNFRHANSIRNKFIIMRRSACIIQAVIRSFLVRREVSKRHVAAIKVQKVFRGFIVRKRIASDLAFARFVRWLCSVFISILDCLYSCIRLICSIIQFVFFMVVIFIRTYAFMFSMCFESLKGFFFGKGSCGINSTSWRFIGSVDLSKISFICRWIIVYTCKIAIGCPL